MHVPPPLSDLVQAILTFVDAYERRPSIDHVAGAFGMTAVELRRSLHDQCAMSFRMLVARSRVDHAARNIQHGMKIEAAIRFAGFTNRTNFNRLFRRYYGCVPREYRSRFMSSAAIVSGRAE